MEAGGTDCIIVFDLVDYEFILILQLSYMISNLSCFRLGRACLLQFACKTGKDEVRSRAKTNSSSITPGLRPCRLAGTISIKDEGGRAERLTEDIA